MTGIEVCREIRSNHPDVACIMLTSFADDEAMLAGGHGGRRRLCPQADPRGGPGGARCAGSPPAKACSNPTLRPRVLDRLRAPSLQRRWILWRRSRRRRRRILDYIAEGMTNRQIGEAMYLAEKTVKNYVSNLLSKLGMERRSQAAAFAARLDERREPAQPYDRRRAGSRVPGRSRRMGSFDSSRTGGIPTRLCG